MTITEVFFDVRYKRGNSEWRSYKKRTRYLDEAVRRAEHMKFNNYEVQIVRVTEVLTVTRELVKEWQA